MTLANVEGQKYSQCRWAVRVKADFDLLFETSHCRNISIFVHVKTLSNRAMNSASLMYRHRYVSVSWILNVFCARGTLETLGMGLMVFGCGYWRSQRWSWRHYSESPSIPYLSRQPLVDTSIKSQEEGSLHVADDGPTFVAGGCESQNFDFQHRFA